MKKSILLLTAIALFTACSSNRDEDSENITSEGKNYEILRNQIKTEKFDGVKCTSVYRIRAIRDFIVDSPPNRSTTVIRKGQLGGWIEKKENLAGNAWVYSNAVVLGNAKVYGNALIANWSVVYGNAKVYEYARIFDEARVYDNAEVYGQADVYGYANVFGTAKVGGKREITEGMIDKGTYE